MQKNKIEITGAESIARAIAKIAPILMLRNGWTLLEFKTPGFGLFGFLGGICLILFFGHHIAGLSEWKTYYFF